MNGAGIQKKIDTVRIKIRGKETKHYKKKKLPHQKKPQKANKQNPTTTTTKKCLGL